MTTQPSIEDPLRRKAPHWVPCTPIFALLLFSHFIPVAPAVATPDRPSHYAPTDTVLILGAVPQEIPPFVEAMATAGNNATTPATLWGVPYWRGRIHGTLPVVVAITGIGKTKTAVTLTLFLREFRPKCVLMSGTGARVNRELRTGDVVVATHLHEHDYGSLTKDKGMVYRPFNTNDLLGSEMPNDFSPSPSLLAIAKKAIASYIGPTVTLPSEDGGDVYQVTVRTGGVSSSDLFGVTGQRLHTLRTRFRTDIMEMESAPLAHACAMLGVPFLVVRAGSNVAQEAPNDDYLRLGPIAAKQAALFTLHVLDYLADSNDGITHVSQSSSRLSEGENNYADDEEEDKDVCVS